MAGAVGPAAVAGRGGAVTFARACSCGTKWLERETGEGQMHKSATMMGVLFIGGALGITSGCNTLPPEGGAGPAQPCAGADGGAPLQPCTAAATAAPTTSAPQPAADWYGDRASDIVHLQQGWDAAQRSWFYTTSQGSALMPYAHFMALEQADNEKPFRDPHNMRRFRWLTEYQGKAKNAGLPLGFVRHKDSIGLTCSACHTTQINYRGTGIRIDGGAAMADFESFLEAMEAAMKATLDDDAKFSRFAKSVLADKADDGNKSALKADLQRVYAERLAANKANHSPLRYGFGRLDAFGRIFNRALRLVEPSNGNPANAPVSYPVLWDTPQHDWVQWTGFASNQGTGALQRNVGQIVGVFAHIEVTPDDPRGYASTVDVRELLYMEREVSKLQSPQWPAEILGALQPERVAQGKLLFEANCVRCHHHIDRAAPDRRVQAQMHRLDSIRTDPTAATNIVKHAGRSGVLEGHKEQFGAGRPLGKQALAFQVVSNLIGGILQRAAASGMAQEIGALQQAGGDKLVPRSGDLARDPNNPLAQLVAYKARPLNGIWASAPYLHNGSVPTLYDLLSPPDQRPKTFYVGRREYDPVKVGFVTTAFEGGFQLDTSKAGNYNSGHLFGTNLSATERSALLEYLKSL